MSNLWIALFANLAMVSILVLLWGFISDLSHILPRWARRIGYGLIAGGCSYIVIFYASQVLPGFKFDLRHALLSTAGYFGGPISGLIAGAIAVVARVQVGGAGMSPGIIGIAISTSIGLLLHFLIHKNRHLLWTHLVLAIAVTVGLAASFLAIPLDVRIPLLRSIAGPLFSLTFVATALTAILIGRQLNQRDTLRANNIYARMVCELPECLNAKDIDGRFIAANDATARLMRAGSVEDLIGKTDFDFYPLELAEKFRKDELDVMKSGASGWIDQRVVFPDGQPVWLSTLKTPLYDQHGKLIGLITRNRDITEQRKLAEMKDQFVSTVNHEIRTPLTSINGALGLLASGAAGPLSDKARRLVEVGHANARNLVELVDDVLNLEKIASGAMSFEPSKVCLQAALAEAAQSFGGYLPEKRVRLRLMDKAADETVIDIHPARLQQVLRNLISNAVKFSPPHGEVVIELSATPHEATIAILDDGPGVPPQFEPRMFQRFEQADGSSRRAQGGTGLGLSIAKAIVDRSGGRIWYERRGGNTTAFSVSLPIAEARPAPQPVASRNPYPKAV
jgi:PAS domain S-box-containing protein